VRRVTLIAYAHNSLALFCGRYFIMECWSPCIQFNEGIKMTLMQYIKLVLDDAYQLIEAADDSQKDILIKTELTNLQSEYGKLTCANRVPIDYSNPVKRFAYIYKYTVAHADYVRQVIDKEPSLQNKLTSGDIRLACLGGGPGSDLLGVIKFMIGRNVHDSSLISYIFDKERAWGDSWSDVAIKLSAPFKIYPVFEQMDITDERTWRSYQKYLNADVFTLSYFLSELYTIRLQAQPFLNYCLSRMKHGSMLLFVDNGHTDFSGWFDDLASSNKLEVLLSKTERMVAEHKEEKTDLDLYYTKFSSPKCQAEISYRVVRKP
jgi:hypothetical protein